MRSGEARKKFPNNSVNNVITLATRVRIQLLKVNICFLFYLLTHSIRSASFCQFKSYTLGYVHLVVIYVIWVDYFLYTLSCIFIRAWPKNICKFTPVEAPSWPSSKAARKFWWGWRRPTDRRQCPLPRQSSRPQCLVRLPTLSSKLTI